MPSLIPLALLAGWATGDARIAKGREVYETGCALCHGANGKGNPDWESAIRPIDFSDCGTTAESSEHWQMIVARGGRWAGLASVMPAFGEAFTEEEISAVVAYIRTFCAEAAESPRPRRRVGRRADPTPSEAGHLASPRVRPLGFWRRRVLDRLVGCGPPLSDQPTERTRTIRWEDPLATAALGRGMSGLEFLEKIRRGEIPRPPIGVLMDFSMVELGDGRVTFALVPAEFHYNPIGVVHGGVAATLLDTCMGCSVHSKLPQGRAYTTLDIQVRYLRPLTRETGRVLCTAVAVHVGGKVASAEGRIVDEAGKLYATGTTSCLVFDIPTAPPPGAGR